MCSSTAVVSRRDLTKRTRNAASSSISAGTQRLSRRSSRTYRDSASARCTMRSAGPVCDAGVTLPVRSLPSSLCDPSWFTGHRRGHGWPPAAGHELPCGRRTWERQQGLAGGSTRSCGWTSRTRAGAVCAVIGDRFAELRGDADIRVAFGERLFGRHPTGGCIEFVTTPLQAGRTRWRGVT
jgi:hypothetical protein